MAQNTDAALELYDHRRVTRAQFEAFENGELPTESVAYKLLEEITPDHRKELLNKGKAVCRIDIRGTPEGTGFHLGDGWVMTNQHVICKGDEETSSAGFASFHFPEFTVEARSREVIFAYFKDPVGTLPWNASKKDLALIFLKEIANKCDPSIPGLNNPFQRPARDGESVYLIHYGDGTDQSPPPQQFSISGNTALRSQTSERVDDLEYTEHSAHCGPGSSGAPLLVYGDCSGQPGFVVAGVHFPGNPDAGQRDSPGFAILFHRHSANGGQGGWLHNTVPLGYLMRHMDLTNQPVGLSQYVEDCRDLQKKLKDLSMRATIPKEPPNGVSREDFPSIIWKPHYDRSPILTTGLPA